jgi:hypothetical protein
MPAACARRLIYIYFCTPCRAIKHSGWLIIEVLEFGGRRQMLRIKGERRPAGRRAQDVAARALAILIKYPPPKLSSGGNSQILPIQPLISHLFHKTFVFINNKLTFLN